MLDSVRHAVEIAGGEYSEEAMYWLRIGLSDFLIGRGVVPLEVCLNLTCAQRKEFRDQASLKVADILFTDGDTAWELAGRMLEAVSYHESRTRNRAELTPLNQALRDARSAGCAELKSRKRLAEFLRGHFRKFCPQLPCNL